MKTKSLLLFYLLAVVFSCTTHHFSEFIDFGENNRWQKSDVRVFEFEVSEDSQVYNIEFRFSHVYDYQFASIPINFSIESPDGKIENYTIELAIRDNNGKELADCSGDICDLFYRIKENKKLVKGIYKISVSHNFEGAEYLPNVIGIGLNVDREKK